METTYIPSNTQYLVIDPNNNKITQVEAKPIAASLQGRPVIVQQGKESHILSGLFWTAVGCAFTYHAIVKDLPYFLDTGSALGVVVLLMSAGAVESCFERAAKAFSTKPTIVEIR